MNGAPAVGPTALRGTCGAAKRASRPAEICAFPPIAMRLRWMGHPKLFNFLLIEHAGWSGFSSRDVMGGRSYTKTSRFS